MYLWDRRIIEIKSKDFPTWTKKKPATSINSSIYMPKLMHAMKERIKRENGKARDTTARIHFQI